MAAAARAGDAAASTQGTLVTAREADHMCRFTVRWSLPTQVCHWAAIEQFPRADVRFGNEGDNPAGPPPRILNSGRRVYVKSPAVIRPPCLA
jgi:hypothetical protein